MKKQVTYAAAWMVLCCVCAGLCVGFGAPTAMAQKKSSKAKQSPAQSSAKPATALPAKPVRTACTEDECKAHLQFLAADRLLGRNTGSAGCDTAAAYIERHFASLGIKPPSGMSSHLQTIGFTRVVAPKSTTMSFGEVRDSLNVVSANIYATFARATDAAGRAVQALYVGFGVVDSTAGRDDYKDIDVRGKLLVARFGLNDSSSLQQNAGWVRRKREAALKRGAVGVLELLGGQAAFAWVQLGQFVNRPRLTPTEVLTRDTTGVLGAFLVNDGDKKLLTFAQQRRAFTITLASSGSTLESVQSQNVLAVLPGSDPALRNEYVLLSAHYDHIGTASRPGQQDSIYNGARDNGMGTTALLGAASILASKPPKRSVVFAAWTGEEMGLLGSAYYAEHPAVPHNNVIFNLNTDGAGFNDTTLVTVIGLDRTTAEDALKQAAETQGLKAVPDPAPEQNLFDRSDNVSFAAKGIPAPTFAPGFKAFDAEISKYYHQAADEAGEDFNFRYLTRYVNAFVDAARRISDAPERPRWKAGDKYETAFQKLYGAK